MSATIVLVRHGPSVHAQKAGLLDRAGILRWRNNYDAAGIIPESRPPESLVQIARDTTHIITSDIPRALMSASVLSPSREFRVSDLFREAPLAIPQFRGRLPLTGWALLIHLNWTLQLMRGIDANPDDRARVVAASDWLTALVADGSSSLVVTHGVFRKLLSEELVRREWKSTGRQGGYSPWSAWSLSSPGRTR